MSDLIKKTAIKKRIKDKGCNTSLKALERFDQLLASIIDESCERANKNNRKTVMPQDV